MMFCLSITLVTGTTYAAGNSTSGQVTNVSENGNHNIDPYLIYNLNQKLYNMGKNQSEISYTGGTGNNSSDPNRIGSSYPTSTSLPHKGTPKMLVILIDFPDYPHAANQTVKEMQSLYFGDGSAVNDSTQNPYPYESLHNWYQRSSYGALNITGDVLGWYTTEHTRDYYDGYAEDAIMEAIDYYDFHGFDLNGDGTNEVIDFSQYDNNRDGQIEGLAIKWTGPVGEWSSNWWPYMTSWYDNSDYTVDDVTIGSYTWEDYSPSIKTDIHETGHLLGLPDLYDYDTQTGNLTNIDGPGWGVGGLDMMDGADCDFNSFFKLLFGWITPYYVNNTQALDQQLILNSMENSSYHGCVVICPGKFNLYGNEFYMVEYRTKTKNDEGLPGEGLYIWHMDTTLDDSDGDGVYDQFYYDNTGTIHNLVDLIQADGLFDIQNGTHNADAGDIYVPHYYFGPNTTPNSNWYNGTSGIYVYDINNLGSNFSAYFGWQGPPKLGSALGNPGLNWTTGGSENRTWIGTRITGQNDTYSAQSGYIHDNESTWMSTIVNGTGFLSFDWKVSSEEDYDNLSFYIDGVLQSLISGEVNWENLNFTLGPGLHVLKWNYSKDDYPDSSEGFDCGWVDNIFWDNTPPIIKSIEPTNNTFSNIINKTISIIFSENVTGGSVFDGIGVVGPSGVVLVSKSIVGNVLTLTPYADYADGVYTVNIPANAVNDKFGNAFASAFESTFTIDTVNPTITSITPTNNTQNPTDNVITVIFSENVTGGSAFNGIGVVGPSGVVLVSKGIRGNVLTLTADGNYADGVYTVNIPANALKDLAGNNLKTSCTTTFSINKTVPTVWADLKGGLYNSNKVVKLSMNEWGVIYYTLNGSTPNNSSLKYSGPINIASTTTLKFMALDGIGNPSAINSVTYTIDKISPKVVLTYPKRYATGVSRTANIYLKFSVTNSRNHHQIFRGNFQIS